MIVSIVVFFIIKSYTAAFVRPKPIITKECKYCISEIPLKATVCKFCTAVTETVETEMVDDYDYQYDNLLKG